MEDFPSNLDTCYNDLEVTRVAIRMGTKSEKSLAYCDITFNDVFKVNNIEVRETDRGTREILMPYRRDNMQPRYRLDFAHPVEKEMHMMLRDLILFCYSEYERTGNKVFGL